ncbi:MULTISPECIES: M43 family zinc metalloprotease [Mesoflavibacter]|uniref:M43 family zinc metalloprotease n=1 Tax=Mesoflavibacter profundi TaxID=2708110 RepID=A0ABT4S2A1_9FLAO|nr:MULTISPECIES: M43 family zinc metalloprotease [Mesoflavibacter]MDA0178192.1 M43 family zinc metalloprotease [Mesoflavibacter profundi]QIJ89154.1 hypothetical protein C7H62_1345 [Mesoflavibacter sp. HG96]QIJ91882.1 hypothetical protein C7H56_1345 [Mesoflavibacter sp. HG37]
MKNFTLSAFLLTFIAINFSIAQNKIDSNKLFGKELTEANKQSIEETGFIRCGSSEYEQYLKQTNPNRATSEEFENWIAPKIQELKAQRANSPSVVITIPVIFHIFTDGFGPENLSQATIQAQLDQLNIDYANAAGSPFASAADTEIQFCLAKQDENGAPLAEFGINRVTTYGGGPFSTGNFETTYKPATQWDPTSYFNIWVADITGGVLGYAQFPDNSGLAGLNPTGGAANTDGVVVLYSSVGSVANPNPNGGQYASGRTLTHEAGHWLGLRHIWGDTTSCNNDDFCADTPDSTGSNFGCPTGTDNCIFDGLGNDMIENYMDYTDDTCMNTFTADQKLRIDAVMANSPRRMELATSIACNEATVYNLDGRVEINSLNLIDCGTTITPEITLTNMGNNTITSATISYFLDTDTPSTYPWTGSLAMNQSEIITLPSIDLTSGNHIFNVELVNPNGSTDLNPSNDIDTSNSFAAFYDTATIEFELIPDDYGSETTWEFRDSSNTILYSGGPYTNNDSTPVNDTFTVTIGECYTFTINDSFGDGICCAYGNGSYELRTDNNDVIFAGGAFDNQENVVVSVNNLSVDSFSLANTISIYPNPTTDVLNIKATNNNLPESYKVYNMLGQLVASKTILNDSDLAVSTSNYSNGMYFIKIEKEGNVLSLPFIKK